MRDPLKHMWLLISYSLLKNARIRRKPREKQTLKPGTGVIKYILKNEFWKNIFKKINEI